MKREFDRLEELGCLPAVVASRHPNEVGGDGRNFRIANVRVGRANWAAKLEVLLPDAPASPSSWTYKRQTGEVQLRAEFAQLVQSWGLGVHPED